MGSPLGPTFSNFYMCNLENNVLINQCIKQKFYCRYVDDIFLIINSHDNILNIKSKFEANSVLKFTYKIEKDN